MMILAFFLWIVMVTVLPQRSQQKSTQTKRVRLYAPHTGQLSLHKSTARFRVIAMGRRFGKTLYGCNEISKFALTHRNANCAWVAPSYRQSKIAYRLIRRALREVLSYKSDSDLRLEFPNGSSITFFSSDNYDALRGNGFHAIILDEVADIDEKAWTEVLRPTLSDTNGWAVFIGTPKGRNFFYKLFSRGQDPEYPEWESFNAPTSDNPYIPKAEIETAQRELPEDTFQQEFLARFLDFGAGVFKGIDACITGTLDSDYKPVKGHYYVVGLDLAKYQDFSVATLIDCHTKHVVGWQRINQIDYTVQLEMVAALAETFHAHVLVDMSGVGDMPVERLTALGQKRNFTVEGYLFTNSSKKVLIENLQIGIQSRDIGFPDIPVMISELRMFEYVMTKARQLSYSAPKGQHDDTVISLALAYMAAKQPHGPIAWSLDIDTPVRTNNMPEFPENQQPSLMEIETYASDEGDWFEY